MSDANTDHYELSDALRAEIDKWVAKYPEGQSRSAILAALTMVQDDNGGWLSEAAMRAVADYLELPEVVAYEVATFYHMFDRKPVGRNKIWLCTNVSCMLSGSDKIEAHIKKKLGVELGETTADGRVIVREMECLGACVNAPMMQVNRDYHEHLTTEKVDAILEGLE